MFDDPNTPAAGSQPALSSWNGSSRRAEAAGVTANGGAGMMVTAKTLLEIDRS